MVTLGVGIWMNQSKSCDTSELEIEPFNAIYSENDTTWFKRDSVFLMSHKLDHFLVKNYCDTKEMNLLLDSLVCTLIPKDYLQYGHYHLDVFKESKYTNDKFIKAHPRSFDRYSLSHDWLFEYWHFYGLYPGTFIKRSCQRGKESSIDFTCFDLLEPDKSELPSNNRFR